MIFFYLCKQQVPLPNILKTIFVVGMGYALITLVQQVTYPITPFGTRAVGSAYSDFFSGGVEKRMGFYRFSVGGLYYGVLAFFFVLVSFRLPHKRLLLVILGASIVACGNRQTMFSVFVSVVYYYLFSKNVKNKYLILVMLLIVVFFLYVSADAIFGKLVNIEGDLEDGRMPSYIFYWDKITDSPLAFLLGNGLPNSASSYGQQIDVYDNFRVTPSDIGIVGTMYYWGGIYVVAYLVAAIKWLKDGRLPILYKAIILSFLLCCPIAGFLWEIDGFMLQGIIFYLCDANVRLKV